MRPRLTTLLAVGLGLAFLAPAARAQDEEPVYSKITPKQMEKILRDMGFEYTKKSNSDDKVQRWALKMEIDGKDYNVLLLSDGTDMQIFAGFEGKQPLKRLNEWNRGKRWGRAYLTKDGDGVALETDLDFAGGVSTNCVREFIKLYKILLTSFVKFIKEDSE